VAFAETADRGIARHGTDGRKAMGDECGPSSQARRGRRGLAAGVSAAHDDDIKLAIHAFQAFAPSF
jgi:hypothetical protein